MQLFILLILLVLKVNGLIILSSKSFQKSYKLFLSNEELQIANTLANSVGTTIIPVGITLFFLKFIGDKIDGLEKQVDKQIVAEKEARKDLEKQIDKQIDAEKVARKEHSTLIEKQFKVQRPLYFG